MSAGRPSKDEIFNAAAELSNATERQAYLNEVCADHPQMRREIEDLLELDRDAGSFLESPPPGLGATLDQPITEKPGTQIGPYKLLQQLGEGGMGVVYMAEQKEPVKRRVALKIIKPGMDTRQVIARFEAERQALAMMDHPNIAKVLDAGATDSGRPYFVMELVNGLPVTKYCDEQHLTPKERLELFVPICQAVQHAHQKGIIHRDLKPSNILVALYDGQPVPKVIDFGVAKATSQTLTEKTMFTQLGQVVGTLEYMSPEQAERNQLDVDTRSDIYSLGVVLYELLTGETPFDRERLRSAAFDEMLRIIREEEPSKPSTKVSTSQSLPSIAANRRIEPARLGSTIRGELDWIVMKALEKDRARRYETASKFAEDVQHYLSDEPVVACPPSTTYRLRKFARRNKTAIAVTAALMLVALTVAGGVGWTVRDRAARQARVAAKVESALDEVDRLSQQKKWPEALVVATRAEAVASIGGADASIRQRVDQALADVRLVESLGKARLLESEFVDGKWNRRKAERAFAQAFADAGLTIKDLPSVDELSQVRERIIDEVAASLVDWSRLKRWTDEDSDWQELLSLAEEIDPDPWRRRLRAAWRRDASAKAIRDIAASTDLRNLDPSNVVLLAKLLRDRVSPDEAVGLLQAAQSRHPADFWINWQLAACLHCSTPRRLEEAVTFYHVALALRPETPAILLNLGNVRTNQEQLDEAEAMYRRAVEVESAYPGALTNLGVLAARRGRLDEAIAHHQKAIALDGQFALAHFNLGNAYLVKENLAEAIAQYAKAVEIDPNDADYLHNLGVALGRRGDWQEAVTQLEKAINQYEKVEKRDQAALASTHVTLGAVLLEQENLADAMRHFENAIKIDPRNTSAHYRLGRVLKLQGELERAILQYRKVIEIDESHADAHQSLGIALLTQKQFDQAIEHLRIALKLAPERKRTCGLLLSAYRGKKDWSGMIDTQREMLRRWPDDVVVMNNLAWCLTTVDDLDLRDLQEGLRYARDTVKADPKPWQFWNTLSVAAFRAGEMKESLAARNEKNQRNPIGTEDKLFLAMTHWRLGDEAAGKKWLSEAVAEMQRLENPKARLQKLRQEAEDMIGPEPQGPSDDATSNKLPE